MGLVFPIYSPVCVDPPASRRSTAAPWLDWTEKLLWAKGWKNREESQFILWQSECGCTRTLISEFTKKLTATHREGFNLTCVNSRAHRGWFISSNRVFSVSIAASLYDSWGVWMSLVHWAERVCAVNINCRPQLELETYSNLLLATLVLKLRWSC